MVGREKPVGVKTRGLDRVQRCCGGESSRPPQSVRGGVWESGARAGCPGKRKGGGGGWGPPRRDKWKGGGLRGRSSTSRGRRLRWAGGSTHRRGQTGGRGGEERDKHGEQHNQGERANRHTGPRTDNGQTWCATLAKRDSGRGGGHGGGGGGQRAPPPPLPPSSAACAGRVACGGRGHRAAAASGAPAGAPPTPAPASTGVVAGSPPSASPPPPPSAGCPPHPTGALNRRRGGGGVGRHDRLGAPGRQRRVSASAASASSLWHAPWPPARQGGRWRTRRPRVRAAAAGEGAGAACEVRKEGGRRGWNGARGEVSVTRVFCRGGRERSVRCGKADGRRRGWPRLGWPRVCASRGGLARARARVADVPSIARFAARRGYAAATLRRPHFGAGCLS